MDNEKISDFLQECDDFSAWLKSACPEELEMFATSDGYYRVVMDMIAKTKEE